MVKLKTRLFTLAIKVNAAELLNLLATTEVKLRVE